MQSQKLRNGVLNRRGASIYMGFFWVMIVFLMLGFTNAYAQFEGTFKVNQYVFANDGRSRKISTADISVTPMRIRIDGLDGSKLPAQLGGITANSILIRLDMQDFIIFGNKSEAVQIKKSEIVDMVNMIDNLTNGFGDNDNDTDTAKGRQNVIKTKEVKVINGYKCHKIIVIDKDENEIRKTVVWLTDKIPVNWGMLTQSWSNNNSEVAQLLTPAWLMNGSLPIYAEIYQNGIKKMALKVVDIRKHKVAPSQMVIPTGVQLLSFRQLLLHNMFGR